MTNKENKVLYIYRNVKSEKYFLPKFSVYNIFLLPPNTTKKINKGDILKIVDKDKQKDDWCHLFLSYRKVQGKKRKKK